MYYIYMDNYRGFHEAVCPVSSVNFLVGENSTGKSSLLQAIAFLVMFPDRFPASSDLSDLLGLFKDSLSAGTGDSKSFRLGWFRIDEGEDGLVIECASYVLGDVKGVPVLRAYAEKRQGFELSINLSNRSIRYLVEEKTNVYQETEDAYHDALRFTKECGRALEQKGYTRLKGVGFADSLPLQILSMVILTDWQRFSDVDISNERRMRTKLFDAVGVVSIDPVRSAPKKYYDSQVQSGDNGQGYFAYIELNRLVKSRKSSAKEMLFKLEQFGLKSGLYDSLKTESLAGGSFTAPFQVTVEYGGATASIKNVGYGVSQILPVLMECIDPDTRYCYLIQQPEVHLHPRAQAAFGDLLHESSMGMAVPCFVETHSDYLIDHFRLAQKASEKKESCQVLFFERRDRENVITSLPIDDEGRYPEEQPDSFRAFFLDEAFMVLGLS